MKAKTKKRKKKPKRENLRKLAFIFIGIRKAFGFLVTAFN